MQAIKNWMVETSGNEAELKLHLLVINKRNDVTNSLFLFVQVQKYVTQFVCHDHLLPIAA